MLSEAALIGFVVVGIIVLSFMLVICILPFVDKFCSSFVGPAWVPECIVRESDESSKFLPSLTKEERILVLEKVFQVRVSHHPLYTCQNTHRYVYVEILLISNSFSPIIVLSGSQDFERRTCK